MAFNDWLMQNSGLLGVGSIAGAALGGLMAPNQMDMLKGFDQKFSGPGAMRNRIGAFYNIAQSSPAYTYALQALFNQQNRMSSQFQTSLGRSGLSKAAAATAGKTLADSATSNAMGGLNAQFYGLASDNAWRSVGMLGNMYGQMPNYKNMFFAAALGGLGKLAWPGGN